jgi:hypothetical protein
MDEYPSSDVRNKYVCFPCQRIWKSAVTKYQSRDWSNRGHLKKMHSKESVITSTEKELSRRPDLLNSRFSDFVNVYGNKQSKCAKCRQDGTQVGRNFRHCRSDKEWHLLQLRVNSGEVNLVSDFHDYPREMR